MYKVLAISPQPPASASTLNPDDTCTEWQCCRSTPSRSSHLSSSNTLKSRARVADGRFYLKLSGADRYGATVVNLLHHGHHQGPNTTRAQSPRIDKPSRILEVRKDQGLPRFLQLRHSVSTNLSVHEFSWCTDSGSRQTPIVDIRDMYSKKQKSRYYNLDNCYVPVQAGRFDFLPRLQDQPKS
jgi:hypothetical protein